MDLTMDFNRRYDKGLEGEGGSSSFDVSKYITKDEVTNIWTVKENVQDLLDADLLTPEKVAQIEEEVNIHNEELKTTASTLKTQTDVADTMEPKMTRRGFFGWVKDNLYTALIGGSVIAGGTGVAGYQAYQYISNDSTDTTKSVVVSDKEDPFKNPDELAPIAGMDEGTDREPDLGNGSLEEIIAGLKSSKDLQAAGRKQDMLNSSTVIESLKNDADMLARIEVEAYRLFAHAIVVDGNNASLKPGTKGYIEEGNKTLTILTDDYDLSLNPAYAELVATARSLGGTGAVEANSGANAEEFAANLEAEKLHKEMVMRRQSMTGVLKYEGIADGDIQIDFQNVARDDEAIAYWLKPENLNTLDKDLQILIKRIDKHFKEVDVAAEEIGDRD